MPLILAEKCQTCSYKPIHCLNCPIGPTEETLDEKVVDQITRDIINIFANETNVEKFITPATAKRTFGKLKAYLTKKLASIKHDCEWESTPEVVKEAFEYLKNR